MTTGLVHMLRALRRAAELDALSAAAAAVARGAHPARRPQALHSAVLRINPSSVMGHSLLLPLSGRE